MEQKILELQPFMFGAAVSTPPPPKEKVCGDAKKTVSPQNMKKSAAAAAIEPKYPDTLLWCCYILLNGVGAYEYLTTVSSTGFSNADGLDLRRALVDEISKNPKKKSHSNHKITKVALEEIKSNLLTGAKFKIPELIVFCVYYNKNVRVIFDNKCYMNLNNGTEDDDAVLDAIIYYNSRDKKYSIICGGVDAMQPPAIDNMVLIEQYTKPVRGFSCYKTAELEEIYEKLRVVGDERGAPTKKEMYEFIHKEICGITFHIM